MNNISFNELKSRLEEISIYEMRIHFRGMIDADITLENSAIKISNDKFLILLDEKQYICLDTKFIKKSLANENAHNIELQFDCKQNVLIEI